MMRGRQQLLRSRPSTEAVLSIFDTAPLAVKQPKKTLFSFLSQYQHFSTSNLPQVSAQRNGSVQIWRITPGLTSSTYHRRPTEIPVYGPWQTRVFFRKQKPAIRSQLTVDDTTTTVWRCRLRHFPTARSVLIEGKTGLYETNIPRSLNFRKQIISASLCHV